MGNCECCRSDGEPPEMVQVEPEESLPESSEPKGTEVEPGSPTPHSEQSGVDTEGLSIQFESQDGQLQTAVFKRQPLGLDFMKENMPIAVVESKGHAESLGVKKGWLLRRIGTQSLDAMSFREAATLLVQCIADLPQPAMPIELFRGLPVEFACPDGSSRSIVFSKTPLGMYFEKEKMPIELVAAKGHAEELGVQKAWQVKSLGGIDLAGFNFAGAMDVLREKLASSMREEDKSAAERPTSDESPCTT